MRNFVFIITIAFFGFAIHAQTPRLSKYDIGTTGCKIYLPSEPGFELSYSEDSSEVWTAEVESGSSTYAVICVRFNEGVGTDERELLDLLESYLDFLQSQFGITGTAGYGEGHRLSDYDDVYGVIDFWEDADALQYSVMGWINSDYLAVMMIYGSQEADYNAYNLFFQGMRFPE